MRWRLGLSLLGIACILGFFVTSTRIVLNGTHSLPENGYLMLSYPVVLARDRFIAAEVPEAYADQFVDMVFVKRVVGLPGDRMRHENGALCIGAECFPAAMVGGKTFDALTPEGVVPKGFVAAFGSAPDSLDSRYVSIGLFAKDSIVAAGWAMPIPHWKEIRTWLDG